MAFTEEPRHRDLGQVIAAVGGVENFNRLHNPPVAGGPERTRRRRTRRRPPSRPSRRLPARWLAHPDPWDDDNEL